MKSTRRLKDRSFWFLNKNPELDLLQSAVVHIALHEDVELNENIIRKLTNIKSFEFRDRCRLSYLTFELLARTCKWLRSLSLCHQTLTERLLRVLSEHLVNLEHLRIWECHYETLKPLARFLNLEYVELDFDPAKDELTLLFEHRRPFERLHILGKDLVELLRTTTAPKLHRITNGIHHNSWPNF